MTDPVAGVEAEAAPPRVSAGHAARHGTVTCANCVAVCCRLTVVLEPGDAVPAHLTDRGPGNLRVMAKDASGWCAALAADGVSCGIYAVRPQACRRFAVNGPYCRAMRHEHAYAAGMATLVQPGSAE